VKEHEGDIEGSSELTSDIRLVERRGREIDRDDDAANPLFRIVVMDGARVHRRRDEHRNRGLSQDSFGRRAEKELARARLPFRAHDNQVAGPLARDS
jgi:hypothetical protein